MTLAENDDSAWNFVRSTGSFDLCHFLSAALRWVCSDRRVSLSQRWDWEDRAGLVDRGHRLSRQELSSRAEGLCGIIKLQRGECAGGRKSGGNKGGEVGGRQVAEVAAEGNHRCGSSGSSWETHSEVNKIVVRKVQRCDRTSSNECINVRKSEE